MTDTVRWTECAICGNDTTTSMETGPAICSRCFNQRCVCKYIAELMKNVDAYQAHVDSLTAEITLLKIGAKA